jgi:hypothetical protein
MAACGVRVQRDTNQTKSIVRMELESIYETIDNAVMVPKDVILVSMSYFSKGYMLIGPQLYLTKQVAVRLSPSLL